MKIMENKKNKNPVTIMLVISLIVIVLGLTCGVAVYYELSNQIAAQSGGGLVAIPDWIKRYSRSSS